jgi:hypothetical protein
MAPGVGTARFGFMAANEAGRSGIGGASMDATDDAGDKGADDEADEGGMVTEERERLLVSM